MAFYPDEMWWEQHAASPGLHIEIYGGPFPGPIARAPQHVCALLCQQPLLIPIFHLPLSLFLKMPQ